MDDQSNILMNLANSLLPVEKLVIGAAYLIGLVFAVKALFLLKAHADSRSQSGQGGLKEPLVYFFVAGMLIYFPSAFEMLMNTTFGYSNVLAYAPMDSQSTLINALFGPNNALGSSLAIIIQVIGVFAFVKGWLMIAKAASGAQSSGAGGTGKGLMHVFGGILAMNIIGTLQVVSNTLYGAG